MKKIIYDLGCGTNKTSPGAIGVDIRPVTDICASIDKLPFEDLSGDVIISRHSLEHMLDPVKTIREWLRVLKPAAKIIVVLPDHGCINTIDPYYSAGQHLHAYTEESFANMLSLFPQLHIAKSEKVLHQWSFGFIIYKLPMVSIIIPQLGREDGLKKCVASIKQLNYPDHLIETLVIEGDGTVPQKVKEGVAKSRGKHIVYAANDMQFYPDCLLNAVKAAVDHNKALVSFNEGELLPDLGNVCTHFLIRKNFIYELEDQEIFSLSFNHAGADNYLWAQCDKKEEAYYCKEAMISHNHFSKGAAMDDVYQKGWSKVTEDRKILKQKIRQLQSSHQ